MLTGLIWMRVEEFIEAHGHSKIRGTHRTTLEFTKETHLTERGDCIIGVESSKGARDLSDEFKRIVQSRGSRITLFLKVGEYLEVVHGFGSQKLLLTNPTDLVVRKSDYTCNRTLMIKSDKAAIDLRRELIYLLRNPSRKIEIRLVAEDNPIQLQRQPQPATYTAQ
jgi:hypothetical protein